ncbi:MAG: 6-phospho-beta-glucosidase [Defluviitaleaceae bacterium]|nr:6-phospho-beta-glucosidase [Defluviitaleaceae bacterium]
MARGALKVAVIGGGSSYTPELIEGYIKRKDELPIAEIWLVDIEAGREKLEIVGAMAKRMVKAAGLDWRVEITLDRRAALAGADFVSTQFRVGLLDARIKDERIPLSHGVLGQETKGAGGLFKAFRTIPVILDIVKDMKELCPDAWLVNFTNPAGMVTEAAIFHGGWKRTVGLCNVSFALMKTATTRLNIPEEKLTFAFAGLNHFHWHRVWDDLGVERTHELIDLLYKPAAYTPDPNQPKNITHHEYPYEVLKDLGMLPNYYHRYYYVGDDMLSEAIKNFETGTTRAEEVKRVEDRLFELYKDPALDHKPEELSKRGGAHYSDAACELICSIYNDKKTEMVVSTPNNGALTDLPADCVIEASAQIGATGPSCKTWGSLPVGARGLLQLNKAMEQLAIEAAITGDYGKALHAFTLNPFIPAGARGRQILDELLVAHEAHLPQFADAIARIAAEGLKSKD